MEAAPWTPASAPAGVLPGVLFLALASPGLTHLSRSAQLLRRPTSIQLGGGRRGSTWAPWHRPLPLRRPPGHQAHPQPNWVLAEPRDPSGTGVREYLGAASARPCSPPHAQGSPSRSRCTPSVHPALQGTAAGCKAPQLQLDTGPLTTGHPPSACSHWSLSVAVPPPDRHSS